MLGKLGNGPFSSCINYAGLGPAIMIAFTRNKPFMLKEFLKSLPKRLRFGISSQGITLCRIWIKHNNRVAWIKVKHLIWDNLIMYAKMSWARVVKFVKIASIWPKPFSKVLTKFGALGMSFVDVLKMKVTRNWKMQRM